MAANNNATLIGNVGADPDVKPAGSTTVSTFSLAVRRPIKDKNGQEQTDWFRCKLWGKQAELSASLIRKGTKLAVCGAVHIEQWTGNDGVKQTSVIINADGFELLSPKSDGAAPTAERFRAPTPAPETFFADDDIPPF